MKTLISTLILSAMTISQAIQFDSIRYWVGSGSNQAALVVDFTGGAGPRSFVWGYRFNGSATGEQMLRDIGAHDPTLSADIQSFSFGAFLDRISYTPVPLAVTFTGASNFTVSPYKYWSYFTGVSGAITNWVSANVGMSARTLTNGSVDGWSFTTDANFGPGVAPAPAVAANPVPEPATMIVLGLGALGVFRRKRA
jgi:hypothetical protein